MHSTANWVRIPFMADNKRELLGNLLKIAQDARIEISESEALALINDTFFAQAFSSSVPTPDVDQDMLRKVLADWLERS